MALRNRCSPTLFGLREVGVYRRVIAHHNPRKRRWIEDPLEGLRIFVHAEKHHVGLFRQKRPDAIQTPARFIRMHHGRVGQQRAERVRTRFPSAATTRNAQRLRFCQR